MIKNTPMLITKITEYIESKKHLRALHKAYHSFELREHYDFQGEKLSSLTIERGLILIRHLFYLQIVLNKTMHIPGIGLFSIYPRKYNKLYSFPDTLKELSTKGETTWYTEKVIHDNMINKIIIDDKINFERLDNLTFQIKVEETGKFNFIQSIETKTHYLNNVIKKFFTLDELKVIHSEVYKGGRDFKDIVENYKKNQEFALKYFLENIDVTGVGYNMDIIEDLIILIGYIENNKEEFDLD